jgi:hypothetical protein
MPYKNKETDRKYKSKHYQDNKLLYAKRDRERLERNRQWLEEYRKTCVCSVCSESRSVCLDFHHTDPNEKVMTISRMVKSRFSVERIQEEIAKCVVLCANCHRVHHSGNTWTQDSNEGL